MHQQSPKRAYSAVKSKIAGNMRSQKQAKMRAGVSQSIAEEAKTFVESSPQRL